MKGVRVGEGQALDVGVVLGRPAFDNVGGQGERGAHKAQHGGLVAHL